MTFKEFLETTPPNREVEVDDFFAEGEHILIRHITDCTPTLYCENCKGDRIFSREETNYNSYQISVEDTMLLIMKYICRNCSIGYKVFPLKADLHSAIDAMPLDLKIRKIGEYPPFGPPTPGYLITLLAPNQDLFIKGRRSESQGLGVGAFAYYRQLVEKSKDALIDKIAKVSQKQGADEETIRVFSSAKNERQFSKALDSIKDLIPSTLYIENQNPLLLLHDALSEDIHAGTDESALDIAKSVRILIMAVAERMATILSNEAEVNGAVKKLMNRKQSKQNKG